MLQPRSPRGWTRRSPPLRSLITPISPHFILCPATSPSADQSGLNRFLTSAAWDVQVLNERRLEELQKDPSTRFSDRGVIAIGWNERRYRRARCVWMLDAVRPGVQQCSMSAFSDLDEAINRVRPLRAAAILLQGGRV